MPNSAKKLSIKFLRPACSKEMQVKMALLILVLTLLGKSNSESISTDLSAGVDEINSEFAHFFNGNYEIDDIMNELMENHSLSLRNRKK